MFDTIIYDRPYRAGRSVGEAVAEIAGCSGTQFCPQVVAALQRLLAGGALNLASPQVPNQKAA